VTNNQNIDGRSAKILVVDDEEIVLFLARDALEDAGYEIALANGGQEAVDLLEREYFDFILTDIRMPGMNGLELSRKAREINPSIGIIFMTGYANINTAKDAIKEGAYDYIMKPFELKELRQAVKNAIVKKKKDTEKTLSTELDRLSDLNQLMYTVSDRKSLMRLSLGFAMMQSKADIGTIIFRNNNESEMGVISTTNLNNSKFDETVILTDDKCEVMKIEEVESIETLQNIDDHYLLKHYKNTGHGQSLDLAMFAECKNIVNMALKRSDNLYGYLILAFNNEDKENKDSEMKLLSITASQITISLENIILLEESREAYSRLKELQDQTLQLERMATQGEMSSEIGHELNNFLGVITGNFSLLKHNVKKKNFEVLDKYFNAVESNIGNIKKFTDGLMDVSKLKSKFEECNILELIDEVIEYLKAQSRFDNISIVFQRPAEEVITMVDSRQMQQLLYNLMNNSADSINENENNSDKRINVKVKYDSADNSFAISVKDNGSGISDEYLHQAFKERFTTKESGHGFGLLVCDKIVEHHKGKLEVTSNSEFGTEITIKFPLTTELAAV